MIEDTESRTIARYVFVRLSGEAALWALPIATCCNWFVSISYLIMNNLRA